MDDHPLSIYDVIRMLATRTQWLDESETRRVRLAIDNAEAERVFGTEGMKQL